MSFTLFRIVVLIWNSLPSPARRFLSWTRLPALFDSLWFPYRELPIHPTEIPVRKAIEAAACKGGVCVDVGANYGIMTQVMAAKTGSNGTVVAFEAHPLNAKILSRRMRAKGYGKFVKIENMAVSDGVDKSVWLCPGRRHSPNEWNIMGRDVAGHARKGEIEIPAISLDAYFKPSQRVDVVKIDVEGAEVKVLPGMRRILREQKPFLIVEFHGSGPWEARKEILDAGYRLFALNGGEIPATSEVVNHVLACPPGKTPTLEFFSSSAL